MPLKGFKYPDGDVVSLEDVSRGNVDIERMGVSLPTLLHMSSDRDPDRKPSTTELIQGTCQAFLQRTRDYYIYTDDNAFSLAGTLHHLKLEESSSILSRLGSEIPLEAVGITGIVDLYDKETKTLVDYKFSGSYKIAKCLGVQTRHGYHPTEVYKRSGRWGKKGEPKKVKRYWKNPEKADLEDWSWQINMYRLMLQSQGRQVDKMYVQMIVRDGGVAASRDRGIDRNIYLIEVPYIHDDHLKERFTSKRDLLLESLESREIPDKCSDSETWGGIKCERFCPVREFCPHISLT